jgi:hypothetical protein
VHVDAKGYQFPPALPFGVQNPATASIVVFAVSGSGATQRVTNWWGSLTISNP